MNPLDKDLTTLAAAIGASAEELISYAAEDTLGGYHSDKEQEKFPCGSLWGVEGQVLYALCRWMRPDLVVEVGTHRGASAIHILSALRQNGKGMLTTIDVAGGAGDLIPEDLMTRCTKLTGRGQKVMAGLPPAQIVFEDAAHGTNDVEEIVRAALKHLQPKIVLSHDAMHFGVGAEVCSAWDRVFGADEYSKFLTPPSDCGLAFKVF